MCMGTESAVSDVPAFLEAVVLAKVLGDRERRVTETHTTTHRPDQAGAGVIGPGPFADDLHETPAVLWTAVAMMCLGAVFFTLAVTGLTWAPTVAVWIFVGIGIALSGLGGILAKRHSIMENVH